MKRIYLFCNLGMSTSILAAAMQKAAEDHNLDIEIKAFSDKQILDDESTIDSPDVICLGPQIRFKYDEAVAKHPDKPVIVIDYNDYGSANGEAVLKKALLSLKKFKESNN